MPALPDTIQRERVGRASKASRAIAPSCAHQREASNAAPLSRGHHVHVVSNQPKKGFSTEPCPAVLTLLLPVELARALSRVLFQPHSHWSRCSSSPVVTNRGVSSSSRALPRVHSANGPRPTASVRNRLPHQRSVNRTADRLHHLSRLSSVSGLVGIDPNENGLTHAKASFAPGAKAND
jgi:hypothetical protein